MLHSPTLTATTVESLEPHSTLHLYGGLVRQAAITDVPTHYTPKWYPAGVSAGIIAFERGHKYRCILSGACSSDDELLQDSNGLLNPLAAGPKVGRAAYGGVAGDLIEFIFDPASGGGVGGGLTAGQVNSLIEQSVTRSFNFSMANNDTPPNDALWPEGNPQENDVLRVIRTPTSRKREEFWQRGSTVDDWTFLYVLSDTDPAPEDYEHIQGAASTVWNVVHSRGEFAEDVNLIIDGQPVTSNWVNVDNNSLQIFFDSAQSGTAIVEFRSL